MGKDNGTYNNENGVLIEALGICPDVCNKISRCVSQDERVLRTVSEDDGLIDNCAFCLFVLWVTSDG
jgi:hypothetical protein